MYVWAGIVVDFLTYPYLLSQRLNGNTCRIFYYVMSDLMVGVLEAARWHIWFRHHLVAAHINRNVQDCINRTYSPRCFGSGGAVGRPPRSPYLSRTFEVHVTLLFDLLASIVNLVTRVSVTSTYFVWVIEFIHRRCEPCIANEKKLEYILWLIHVSFKMFIIRFNFVNKDM